MFVAHASRTMANARPKFRAPEMAPTLTILPREGKIVRLHEPSPPPIEHNEASFALGILMGLMLDHQRSKTPADSTKAIIGQAARRYGFKYPDIVGPRRQKSLVAARFDAIYAVHRARPEFSLPQLGRIFNRDHTSILHALRQRENTNEGTR